MCLFIECCVLELSQLVDQDFSDNYHRQTLNTKCTKIVQYYCEKGLSFVSGQIIGTSAEQKRSQRVAVTNIQRWVS